MRKLTIEEKRRRRFTADFRKEQVKLIESGKTTIMEVIRLYDVRAGSIKNWLKRFGSKDVPETIIVGNSKDFDNYKRLERENKELKQFIGEQQIKIAWLEGVVDKLSEQSGIDIKKK